MKMNKTIIFLMGIHFFGCAWAQPVENIGVCLRGDRTIIPGQDLRSFTASISGAQNLGGYFELSSAAAAQLYSFAVHSPQKISVVEPNNPAFVCSKQLATNTRWVDVIIHYPADYLPYCTIIPSADSQNHCKS